MEEKILQAIKDLNNRFDTLDNKFDSLENRFDTLENKFDTLENRFDTLENKFDTLENRFDSLENKFDTLDNKFDSLENKFDTLDNRFDYLKSQVKENTEILKALEHSAQVNKAEHEQMAINVAEISGEVKKINKKLAAIEIITANNWSDIVHLKAIK